MPIAALLAVALIGLIATSWFLNQDALRQAVEVTAYRRLHVRIGGGRARAFVLADIGHHIR